MAGFKTKLFSTEDVSDAITFDFALPVGGLDFRFLLDFSRWDFTREYKSCRSEGGE